MPTRSRSAKQYGAICNDHAGAGTSRVIASPTTSDEVVKEDLERDTEIETTLEELEGYQIVKAIGCGEVKTQRITHRDSKSYFAVLVDDNNRKPVARLHFNGKQKYLGLLDEDKVEIRYPIDDLDEIYAHAESIREAVRRYM